MGPMLITKREDDMAKNDGGPFTAISTRTWLAGEALKALLCNPLIFDRALSEARAQQIEVGQVIVEQARMYASNLLAELEKNR